MAKYDVTHSCGHAEEISLFGKIGDRLSRLGRLAKEPCRACSHQAATAQAAVASEAAGLPALQGSPKQVAWAETIRAEMISQMHAHCERVLGRASESAKPAVQAMVAALVNVANQIFAEMPFASWWIDNRHLPLQTIIGKDARFVAALRVAAEHAKLPELPF